MKVKIIYLLMFLLFFVPTAVLAAQEQVVIDIQGMTCKICPIAIKQSLKKIAGVSSVDISFKGKMGWLTVDDSVSNQALLQAITRAGPYTGKIVKRELGK
jgi:mercuric ion binding protein